MADSNAYLEAIDNITDQLEQYTDSRSSTNNIHSDFRDLSDMFIWFLSELDNIKDKKFSEKELESFLIDIDVRLIQHAMPHLRSLRKEITNILAKFPNEDENSSGVT